MKWKLFPLLLLFLLAPLTQAAPLELHKGDHICLIGNTLADRMQHHGWLETLIHARFPQHQLVFRNLGFSADEVDLKLRLRSANFGSPDTWLTRTGADVIFAFFGYNESFAGKDGLEKFKADLDKFVKDTLGKKYNGKSAPRLVLFSPIAHEDHKALDLPDGKENNERLALYTAAMAEVAKDNKVLFVDLFHPSQELYAKAEPQFCLTINGIHLTENGDKWLAPVIDKALFGEPTLKEYPAGLEKLRTAVLDKNFHWFYRYRTTDGFSIYGGRADEPKRPSQSNRANMAREMEILDVMTANRDKVIWSIAQGGGLKVDDSNTPPLIPVKTNKPGAGPQGTHIFLDPQEAIQKMTVAKGMKVTLFASEKDFPELAKPVQMAFDSRGRLWVAVWPTYPHWQPKGAIWDKLLILEDTNGDGKADKCTVFADNLHCPTGFEFYNGGVLVAQAPDLVFLKDTDGDGKADYRERVVMGLDSADTHHTSNSFVMDPGGAVYFQEGTFHHTQVESPYGPARRNVNAGVFRYEPRTQKFDVYVTYGFANPHGHVFDRWGQDIVIDGTGADPYHAALFSGRLDFPQKHSRPPTVYNKRTRPCPGMEYLSSKHFPAEFQGNLLVGNVIGFQGILRYKIDAKGASLTGIEQEPILSSTDPNFRPSDIKIGPDGAIWFIDWHNPLIGHLQHNLRDPSRDATHGRIYRVTYEGRPLSQSPKIAGEPLNRLFDLLKEPEDRVRYRVRLELTSRKTEDVIAAAGKWLAGLDKNSPDYEHHRLEGLWAHQSHNVVDVDLLKQVLESPDFRARAAAVRVLSYWRDRVPGALELLKKLAADQHPRVRLEAVRAASFFRVPEAAEVPLIAREQPTDVYLDFVHNETMKALDPIWKKALADNKPIHVTSDAGVRFFLRNLPLEQVLKLERSPAVNRELLYRAGVRDEVRREALRRLSSQDSKPEMQVLLDAIGRIDDLKESRDESVIFDLVRLLTSRPPAELSKARAELEKLATAAKQPVIRQIGFVTMINADNAVEKAWTLATRSNSSLRDLVNAMPLIADASLRANLYPKIEPLLTSPRKVGQTAAIQGRYVRIELPGNKRTLTLAEVEVYSGGRNVARQGKATQSSTDYKAPASRAIDGNKSGTFGDGGQTHTKEGSKNPWWEVDLGAELPIDSIMVYNRTDAGLGNRLAGFTLLVQDRAHHTTFEKKNIPAPTGSSTFAISGESPERLIRHSAMQALTTVRGQETHTFQLLAKFLKDDSDRPAAIRALQRIPKTFWPKDETGPLVDTLLAYIRKVPAKERTTPAALDALEFTNSLTTLLPSDEGKKVRLELGELGVRVIRVGTLLEKMSFDKEILVVKAGKPVEFLFENTDLMPHNLAIVVPGALEEIGEVAEKTAQQPDAQARGFIPRSSKVLLASRLLQPRETEKLSWVAPKQPGVYPYVCTYPGHYRRMHGALYVVDDLDAYQANPEAYLAKNPLPIKDALLKDRRPRTEWKYDDLVSTVEQLKSGRSYGNGKQMFQVASCVSCHKLEGVGNEFGPDFLKLDPKVARPTEFLRHVLEPSLKIDDKYQQWIFETKAGKTITGMILEESGDSVKIIENPLAKAEPRVLKKADIETRTKSPVSLMPKGLLDKLSRDEILDLVAYILAKGDRKSLLFQGDAHEHHGH